MLTSIEVNSACLSESLGDKARCSGLQIYSK